MRTTLARTVFAGMVIGLAACSSVPVGVDGVACVGRVEVSIPGAVPASDGGLLKEAQGATGLGGLCAGQVVALQQPLRAYRVYDGQRPGSEHGRWWTLTRPDGTRDQYRRAYAICPAWSALDRLTSCDIKASSQVAIGTTQSADCGAASLYPKAPTTQIYVPNDALAGSLFVDNCRDEGPWPAP